MLGKLIKYDLNKIKKTIIIYLIITVIFCIITRIMNNFTTTVAGKVFYSILRGISISCLVGVLINAMMSIWVRFRRNIYADESYLTHTLPVDKKTLYNSKIISAVITIILTLIGILTCGAIVFLNKDLIEYIKNLFNDSNTSIIVISFLITAVLEIIYAIFCGIVGILIGHQSNNKMILRSIVIGILLYYIVQTILLVAIYGIGLLNDDIRILFQTNPDINNLPAAFKNLAILSNILYVVFIIGLYIVGKKIFKKGVNVE